MKAAFTFEIRHGSTIIENHSDFILEISEKPISPKRKIWLKRIVAPKSSLLLDYEELKIEDLYFSFKMPI